MSNILRLASGQVDSNHVEVLESQLNEARNEIQTLSTKLTKISSDEVNIMLIMCITCHSCLCWRWHRDVLSGELAAVKLEMSRMALWHNNKVTVNSICIWSLQLR